MKKITRFLSVVVVALLFGSSGVWAQEKGNDKERAELATQLKTAKIPLEKGLSAAESQGKPISGKYEVEDGKLQLSVYTMKGDKFSEVIVDHKTGRTAKTEAITGGDDLAAAKAQSGAMAKTKVSLRAATEKAVKTNAGFRAVSAMPSLREGHPVAEVTLVKGEQFKTVSEKLD